MIIINFKNYESGKSALPLVRKIEKYLPNAIICPSTIDIELTLQNTKSRVYAQHADLQEGDKTTGYNTLKVLKKVGISGTLINHSEHPISILNIKKLIILSKKYKLKGIVCVSSLKELKNLLKLKQKPYAIAFEDPKLIGTGNSITKYNPKTIIKFVKTMKKTKIIPLCGAGISTAEDVKRAYALGCNGILISSAIANSKNPIPLLKQLKKFQ